MRSGCLRALVALLLCTLCLLTGAGPAAAHASLVGQTPAEGSTVRVAPQRVVLRFDESIRTPSAVVVTGPGGARVDRGSAAVLDDTVTVPVTVQDPGVYTVAYRVVSADGHPAAGKTSFTFRGPGSGAPVDTTSTASASPRGFSAAWVLAGAAVVLVAAAALVGVGRRRSPAASDNGNRR
jgi:methionine-rich copper-binding protein CopC